jgi:hypothetical protein
VAKIAPINWVNGTRALNQEEQQSYLASFDCTLQPEELSSQSTREVLRDGIDGQSERNNAIYICLVPYEGPPTGKRKHNGTPASRIVVALCPVVPILPGDFLGVMLGNCGIPQRSAVPIKLSKDPIRSYGLISRRSLVNLAA